MSWSVGEAIDELVTRLRARPGLADVQVEDAWPGQLQKRERAIWLDDALSFDQVAGMRADKKRYNERYTLVIWCDAYVPGGTAKDARDALTVLTGEVFDELAEQPKVSGNPNRWFTATVAGWRYLPYLDDEGRGASCRIEVQVLARRN